MFIANAALDDGRVLLVLGLSKVNRERMEAGQPVRVSRQTHGMAVPDKIEIVIFAGETEETMREQMASLIGPTTVEGQMKPS